MPECHASREDEIRGALCSCGWACALLSFDLVTSKVESNAKAKGEERSHLGTELMVEAEARWRSLFVHALDGILLTAPDGRIFAANPAACTMLGRTEGEVCAAGRADTVIVDDAAKQFVVDRQRDGHARGILRMRRKDGTTFLADVSSAVFATVSGETRTSMMFRDVTESERARRGLEILADAGRVLASSLDTHTTLANLTTLVVPKLADVCTVDLLTSDGVAREAVAHRDPSRVADFRHVRRRAMRPDATIGRRLRPTYRRAELCVRADRRAVADGGAGPGALRGGSRARRPFVPGRPADRRSAHDWRAHRDVRRRRASLR